MHFDWLVHFGAAFCLPLSLSASKNCVKQLREVQVTVAMHSQIGILQGLFNGTNNTNTDRPTNRTTDQDLGLNATAIPLSEFAWGKKKYERIRFCFIAFLFDFFFPLLLGILDWQQRKITWKIWMWYTLKNVCKRTGRERVSEMEKRTRACASALWMKTECVQLHY